MFIPGSEDFLTARVEVDWNPQVPGHEARIVALLVGNQAVVNCGAGFDRKSTRALPQEVTSGDRQAGRI